MYHLKERICFAFDTRNPSYSSLISKLTSSGVDAGGATILSALITMTLLGSELLIREIIVAYPISWYLLLPFRLLIGLLVCVFTLATSLCAFHSMIVMGICLPILLNGWLVYGFLCHEKIVALKVTPRQNHILHCWGPFFFSNLTMFFVETLLVSKDCSLIIITLFLFLILTTNCIFASLLTET